MKKIVAIVDDEKDILDLVSLHLKRSGFETKEFTDGNQLLQYLNENKPSLIILDLMLPDVDGIELCKKIKSEKRTSDIPVIMLTAKTDEIDVVIGLEIGADDYIKKPFSPKELVARVKAVLRRKEGQKNDEIITIGDSIKIFPKNYEVYVNNEKLQLTTTEFKILKALSENKGWVLSRDELLDILWGNEKIVIDRTIDVHIRHLRKKLGKFGNLIKNIRGIGYKIEE